MNTLHSTLLRYRWLAVWLAAAAMLVKVLVPTGFMPAVVDGVMVVELCTGEGLKTVAVALPISEEHKSGQTSSAHDMPCAFAGLAAPVLGPVQPALLAAALAFILLAALHIPQTPRFSAPARLRPPLRGPPLLRVRS